MNIARRTHALAICSLIAILLGNLVLPASADDAPAIVADASPAPAGVPGAPAMTPEQIKAAEAKALYQNDYGRTLARTVAELVIA